MKKINTEKIILIALLILASMSMPSCINGDDDIQEAPRDNAVSLEGTLCSTAEYPEYTQSRYVLPYPLGKSYGVDLSACTSSYHGPGQPDQFAIDFAMPVGETITASENGRVVYVEESRTDYSFPNNLVIVESGGSYIQYMHLTFNGALVEVNQLVEKGEAIGLSGATGLAGYPHLHIVRTIGEDFSYPYTSAPLNFSNTSPNERGPVTGGVYTAEPY